MCELILNCEREETKQRDRGEMEWMKWIEWKKWIICLNYTISYTVHIYILNRFMYLEWRRRWGHALVADTSFFLVSYILRVSKEFDFFLSFTTLDDSFWIICMEREEHRCQSIHYPHKRSRKMLFWAHHFNKLAMPWCIWMRSKTKGEN